MENQNKVVTGDTSNKLAALANARHGLVKGAKGTGEVIRGYARALCAAFNIVGVDGQTVLTPWYELKGKDKAGVKSERDAFKAEMIAADLGKSVDVYWQRVKEESGYVTKGTVKGGNDTDSLTVKELKTMINRIFKAEEKGEDCKASEIKGVLMEAFEMMGGEVDTLG